MNDKEVLIKAIRLATKNGWIDGNAAEEEVNTLPSWSIPTPVCIAIIFNHDFAEALWGTGKFGRLPKHGLKIGISGWQMRLQQMIVSDKPLQYLEKYM